MTGKPHIVWDAAAELGEGPVWVGDALWFVDIKKRRIHRVTPATGEQRIWDAPEPVGFLFPARSGGFVAGLQSGLYRFDPDDGRFALIARVDSHLPGNRLNDGVVDPDGRLWFGTMDNAENEKSGAFYCFAEGAVRETGLAGITITNGPAVSPDGRILYWVDTLKGKLSAACIDARGMLGTSRLLARIDPADGYPDGPAVDSNGDIWLSLYGGWEVRRFSPSGELLERLRFPVANITKVAFGGSDLKTAYATTARQLLKDDAIAAQPDAGHLFAFEVETAGLPTPPIAF